MTTLAGRVVWPSYFVLDDGRPAASVLITVYARGKAPVEVGGDGTGEVLASFEADDLGNTPLEADPGAPGDYDAVVDGALVPFTVLHDPAAVVDVGTDQTITGAKRMRQGETQFDVRAFGGVSSVAEATATFQAASAEWSANGGGKLNFPANGDYTVNGRIPLLTQSASWIKHFEVAGNGCILRAASGYAGVVLGDALPVDTDSVLLGRMGRIHGFQMFLDGTPGQVGIRVIGGQNHLVHHNKVRGGDIGIDLIFCLGAHVAYNEVSVDKTYDIVVRAGLNGDGSPLWTGATGPGTASNATRIEKCRSYGDAAVKAQIAVLASDEVEVINCITEGVAGEVGVLFDALGNTSARYFRVHNLHSENYPSVAVVRAIPSGGRVVVSGMRNDLGATLVDGRGANTTAVFDLDLQSLFGADMFRADAGLTTWVFHTPGTYGSNDVTDPALWVDGVVPANVGVERFAGADESEISGFGFGLGATRLFLHSAGRTLIKSDQDITGNPGIVLAGRVAQNVAGSAVPGVYLDDDQVAIDTDEGTNEVVITWKKHGGSVRTARIATTT